MSKESISLKKEKLNQQEGELWPVDGLLMANARAKDTAGSSNYCPFLNQ